jgi:hypothetical protein
VGEGGAASRKTSKCTERRSLSALDGGRAARIGELILRVSYILLALLLTLSSVANSQSPSREQWGAPNIQVTSKAGKWTIKGKKNTVTLDQKNLAVTIQTPATIWQMVPSSAKDMLVRSRGVDADIQLSSAREFQVTPYDTGYKTGVKLVLSGWRQQNDQQTQHAERGLTLFLTICLEGETEDVVFDVVALEQDTAVRQLDWPTALDARDVDYTILSNGRGNILPRNWSKDFFPIRTITAEGKIAPTDHSVLQSNVIESWSMSWWGYQKGKSALMALVETPDDAAYQLHHPAGGPTVLGPRWRPTLGRFAYPRKIRFITFDDGNYVDMAKRYRRYVKETGHFVSLQEKIARTPRVKDLIGTPQTRAGILRNLVPESDRYDTKDPSKNYSLTTFDERARQLRELKAKGFGRLLVMVSGWPHLGYDRQHPDPFPPPEKAGGWEGLKRLSDTCAELGYTFLLHDQYRDYYLDAPSYNTQFAIHEEDVTSQPQAFPGTRFGDWKKGQIPYMRHWDGGPQTFLNARFMLGHLIKNNQLLFAHGIRPQGIYIDVVGYVPPDEDFNPEHPTTRTEAMRAQASLLNWSRQNLGLVMTEAGADWVTPFVDSVNQSGGNGKTIPVPLYQLVYHDAVVVSFGPRDQANLLRGLLYGGVPELPIAQNLDEKMLALIRTMAALHERVALLEMTRHEFLNNNFRKERTTFADGTTVTVDWDANSYEINPALQ